jgi:hypothetical protein
MSTKKLTNVKRGDRVRIISGSGLTGQIVELRGPLGPKGMPVYRVLLRKKPKATYVEVREDQLELLLEK